MIVNIGLLFCILSMCQSRVLDTKSTNSSKSDRSQTLNEIETLNIWAEEAYNWLISQDCIRPRFTGERTCKELGNIPKSNIRVYGAFGANRKVRVVFPDGEGRYLPAHDGVVVLDPYPDASFGHLVILFFVDHHLDEDVCTLNGGFIIESGGCMQVSVKSRCRNNYGDRSLHKRRLISSRRCEILFLPLVHLVSELPRQENDKLRCYDELTEFHRGCPRLSDLAAAEENVDCSLRTNSRRCETAGQVKTNCHAMQACDHAVILSGGWNHHIGTISALNNAMNFHSTLRQNGFDNENIKVFFANGLQEKEVNSDDEVTVYSTTLKYALSRHVRHLCSSRCTETLVIYLNSPARPDGSALLWDRDANGEYEELEVYSPKELLRDVQRCTASRVIIIADQSFSGEIVRCAARLQMAEGNLDNVAVVASSREAEWAFGNVFSQHWNQADHKHTCLHQIQKNAERALHQLSHPTTYFGAAVDGNLPPLNTTLTGAPCDVAPPLTDGEIKKYQGCTSLRHRPL